MPVVNAIETNTREAVLAAQALVGLGEEERVELFFRLRRERRLTVMVRGLNELLAHPDHKDLGLRALRSIGLEYAD